MGSEGKCDLALDADVGGSVFSCAKRELSVFFEILLYGKITNVGLYVLEISRTMLFLFIIYI